MWCVHIKFAMGERAFCVEYFVEFLWISVEFLWVVVEFLWVFVEFLWVFVVFVEISRFFFEVFENHGDFVLS